tara:strand:+ start:3683 stop:3919 length:237 start_codon:yes stop_codon:yes gene_type:complete
MKRRIMMSNPEERDFLILSNEALGSLMMALQKSLMEQSDIVPVLQEFRFKVNENKELFIMNPPIVKLDDEFMFHEGAD